MNWQFYVGVAGIIVTVIGSAVGLAYRFGRRFERLQSGLGVLRAQVDSQLTLLGSLIRILHKRKAFDDDEFREILMSYTRASTVPRDMGA